MYYRNIKCEYIAPWIQIFEEGWMTNPWWKIFWTFLFGFIYIRCTISIYTIIYYGENFFEIFWFGFVYTHCIILYTKTLYCYMRKKFKTFFIFSIVLYLYSILIHISFFFSFIAGIFCDIKFSHFLFLIAGTYRVLYSYIKKTYTYLVYHPLFIVSMYSF